DFFALGGHSLLATRLISQARRALGRELPIKALFEARTVAGLAAAADTAGAARPRPTRRPAGSPAAPLSYAQRRMWFLNRRERTAGGAYHSPVALRLVGDLDVAVLHAALGDVVTRHEALRTTVAADGDTVCQRVRPAVLPLPVVEVAAGDLAAAMAAQADRPFDLAADAPLRAVLYRLAPRTHVLLLVFHHVAFDGWSMAPLFRDLREAFVARAAGRAPQQPALPIQYADYAAWQCDLLGDPADPDSRAAAQLDHWRAALAGLPPEVTLPTARPRPAAAGHRGEELPFVVDAGVRRAVAALARSAGATEFMVFHAALVALFARLGAGTDVPIGTSVAGRTDEATDELVGFFVNSLVLRVDAGGEPTFRELLARARAADLAAYDHQDVPFDLVVEAANPPRALGRHPLFQVLLTLQNNEDAVLELPGLAVRPEFVGSDRIKVDVAVQLLRWPGAADGDDTLRGLFGYDTALYDRAAADRLLQRYLRLLAAAVAEPDRPLHELDAPDPAAVAAAVTAATGPRVDRPATTLPELIDARLARTPAAPAVTSGGVTWTAAQLSARADAFAGALRAAGAGPDRVVAVALPRSPEAVAAVLGVLRSGAAFLPVAPDTPTERLRAVFDLAAPLRVVASAAHARRMLATGVPPLVPESLAASADAGAGAPPPLRPAHAAYLMCSAGSAEGAKAIVVSHRAAVNHLLWAVEQYPDLAEAASVPTALEFDVSVTGVLGPLLAGGCVRLTDPVAEPAATAAGPLVKATASHLPLLTSTGPRRAGVRTLVLGGGEPVPAPALGRWWRAHPAVDVAVEYGPVEAAVACLAHRPDRDALPAHGLLPLGRCLPNTRALVLDARLAPVPAGAVGELYIGGDCLARGYAGRPGLTAARFVADPWGGPGARLFRTGDLVLRDDDGDLWYVGRSDDQLRIRGYRVSPAEVEAVLLRHPGVAGAAVALREDRPGEPRLVAYVAAPGAGVSGADLAGHAAARLAEYMVPTDFVILPQLPTDASGHVDRAALPAPGAAGGGTGRPPSGAAEAAFAAYAAEVLRRQSVGADENLFALGMDSMTSLRLVDRANRAGYPTTIADVFLHQTVAGLAAAAL
ncbi:MAG TPA: condensation domain-containing protein, partial [Pilimelia sp.]|nr:condensation domain-containing protein [Pilimelia sp.]